MQVSHEVSLVMQVEKIEDTFMDGWKKYSQAILLIILMQQRTNLRSLSLPCVKMTPVMVCIPICIVLQNETYVS